MSITVSLVAVPIGNIADLSPRAAACLAEATVIFCEDTRKTADLLARAKISTPAKLRSLPGDSEKNFDWDKFAGEDLLAKAAVRWVLVSDAGSPIVNDPGAELLKFCVSRGIAVVAVPGPCAPVLAWQWSGGFGLPFLFAGFAPKAKSAGAKDLEKFFAPLAAASTFVFFDTKHQFEITLAHLVQAGLGDRRIHAAREMTKTHEELVSGNVESVARALSEKLAATSALGELTFVLEGRAESVAAGGAVTLDELTKLRHSPPKEAARIAAQLTGRPTKECYNAFAKKEDP